LANLKRLSKFLALILRHKADDFNLELDADGFTELDHVWKLIETQYGKQYSLADLETVVAGDQNGKKRYEIRDHRIRAMYGHGQVREISYPSIEPPEVLYHGTSQAVVNSILEIGLKSQGRQYVHLTTNLDIASNVGNRHSKNWIILTIRANKAYLAGILFHQAENEHYLSLHIPAHFIDLPN